MRVPRVGRYILRRRTFLFVSLFVRRSRPLRRDPVGQRIGMKVGVITQTKPRAIWLSCLRYRVFLTRGKVVPRIVASDREERPAGAFQMLHQYVAGSRVTSPGWRFAEHFFELLAVAGR